MKCFLPLLLTLSLSTPVAACVGKTLVIGAVDTPRGQFVGQVIAILINERTGTTVKITAFADQEALYDGLIQGDVDIGVDYANEALERLELGVPESVDAAYDNAKSAYLERLNLVWLPALGFDDQQEGRGVAAPVARKDTLKKFPALSRLIAKTKGIMTNEVMDSLGKTGEAASAAREFLRKKKLI